MLRTGHNELVLARPDTVTDGVVATAAEVEVNIGEFRLLHGL
jgi:hypothetical protein